MSTRRIYHLLYLFAGYRGDILFLCRHMTKKGDDVYNFGFILLESLVGPTVTGKGEAFLFKEMV